MTSKARKRPRCSTCGSCCREFDGDLMPVMPSDYRRWERQGRWDILRYVVDGELDLLFDRETGNYLSHCRFLKKIDPNKNVCSIQDTKPEVCKEFWCEWSYGVGKKGIPFRTHSGWTDNAVQLGYGQAEKCNHHKS